MDQNAITLERTTQALTAERAKVAALVEALTPFAHLIDADKLEDSPHLVQMIAVKFRDVIVARAALAKAGV